MPLSHEEFMRIALEEAQIAKDEGNDGVGALVVRGDTIIARGRNLMYTTSDPTAHAETVALRNAGAATGQLRFDGCTLYSTFEPCPMCAGAIIASGIATLVLGGRFDPSTSELGPYSVDQLVDLVQWGDKLQIVAGILPEECAHMQYSSREERQKRQQR